ncbi:hypothetical protein [Candidatus Regiella endosymbiont of Tuberolachnus salignus]|uniref:hypothetical protein n=1 Tax=Candidatus Regiella endosymbiont of Tuberolachnus salignus TaxID=3077956 RepID=UPI0030CFE476
MSDRCQRRRNLKGEGYKTNGANAPLTFPPHYYAGKAPKISVINLAIRLTSF